MINRITGFLFVCLLFVQGANGQSMQKYPGYFDFYWEAGTGKVWLKPDRLGEAFLYVHSLPAGLGSNDIGLDRGQLGGQHLVRFERIGPKILLIESNTRYRALSDNPLERKAVREAFAESTLWGFEVKEKDGMELIDMTPFLLSDAHRVAQQLKSSSQGIFNPDASRSAIYLPNTRNFPQNTEFEATVTFTGEGKGRFLRSVAPNADAITVRMHHSFVQLPGDGYEIRKFDPRSGYYPVSFSDYATPIDQPLEKHYLVRHRLEKKNPGIARSEAVEPIVYYIDPGCPEPIRSALMEGASWWNQAFEAAGYIDAFQVRVLPEGADPMDVRYNMIQWVHRSTRGWSYGSSVRDPRTGEIIKGHVSLGSLRVRQDFLIAQGLDAIYKEGSEASTPLVDMALARLRQLAAHEVGHTLGLMHNYISSTRNRASVMDYPHPFLSMNADGTIDYGVAYDTGIGEWDKRTILYGYQDFPEGTDMESALDNIIGENIREGFRYITDRDSRPQGSMHPYSHLWDNGASPVDELVRLSDLRAKAIAQFGEDNIPDGTPYAYLENIFVPLYLAHRYQVEAVAKMIGGVDYNYAFRGDAQEVTAIVPPPEQESARRALVGTLEPGFLEVPESVIRLIPPPPPGMGRHRELFDTYSGLGFDPLAAAESSIAHTLAFLLHPQRLARIIEHHARDGAFLSLGDYLDRTGSDIGSFASRNGMQEELKRMVEKQWIIHLMRLAGDEKIHQQVRAFAHAQLVDAVDTFEKKANFADARHAEKVHARYISGLIDQFFDEPAGYAWPEEKEMPPGSPIGCGIF